MTQQPFQQPAVGALIGLGQQVHSQNDRDRASYEAESKATNARLTAQQEELDGVKAAVAWKEARILELEADAKKRGEEMTVLKIAVNALQVQAEDRSEQLANLAKTNPKGAATKLLAENSKSIEELSKDVKDHISAFKDLVGSVNEIRMCIEKHELTKRDPGEFAEEPPKESTPDKGSPPAPTMPVINNANNILLTAALNRFEHCLRLVQHTLRSIGTPAAYLLGHQLDTAMANMQFPTAVDLLYKKANNLENQVTSTAALATAALNASQHLHIARLLPLEVAVMQLSDDADARELVRLLKACLRPQALPVGPQLTMPVPPMPVPGPQQQQQHHYHQPAGVPQQGHNPTPQVLNVPRGPNPQRILVGPGGQVRPQPPPDAPAAPRAMRHE